MDTKKITRWGGIGLVLVVVLAGGYYLYSNRSPSLSTNNENPFTNGQTNTPQNSEGGNVRPAPVEGEGGITNAQGSVGGEPVLFQIHDKPIVSAIAFTRQNIPFARFVEQGSGNVFEYNFATKQKTRISNTSIPQIGEVSWSQNGATLAFRYEQDDEIRTAVGLLASSTEEGAFGKITFLPKGVTSIAVSPDGESVFYIAKGSSGISGVVVKKDGTNPRILFTSPLSEWNVSWPSSLFVIVSTPASKDGGIAYKVAIKDGIKTQIAMSQGRFGGFIGNTQGQLLGFNPETNRVALFDSKTSSYMSPESGTWLSKCAFVELATSTAVCAYPPETTPDAEEGWNRGEFNTKDFLISLNFFEGYKQFLVPFDALADKTFDMENISVVPKGNYLVFKNKIDGMLWGVRVPGGIQ